ncbi:uncharacterized protein EDB91DRAFT_1299200 [Suillus paluster]|uniref:uncharacterized protein n=1 Tax=Suillus paluster TaxID=48578 RepID=UPI001B860FE4|nr:uncharacterized protein EDB91DRAFT_1299200 [Suillus paluster]KAG1734051.1 hypothetical protein EDB91DRAFT_1299200 [Suillus paluster]
MADVLQLFDVMLVSVESKTHKNYGAGLLRFHQFCDSRLIPENSRMPASNHLLAAFVASWAGKVTTTTAQNWLTGLHFWHNLHGAPWFGHALVHSATAGLAKVVPPFLLWRALHSGVVADSVNLHITHSTSIRHRSLPNQVPFIVFHLPWMKTTHGDGADIVASKIDNLTNPVSALNHHLAANSNVPPDAPLFAYETAGRSWASMTRPWFLARCNQIWKGAGLLELTGHCFRIGGASELLLRGIPPDVVVMQGRWKSRAFLDYWRKIESILPLFVTSLFTDTRISLIHSSMDSYARRYK